jgi:hypothetical protein
MDQIHRLIPSLLQVADEVVSKVVQGLQEDPAAAADMALVLLALAQ